MMRDEVVGMLMAVDRLKKRRRASVDAPEVAMLLAKEAAYMAEVAAVETSPARVVDLAFRDGHARDIAEHEDHFDAALGAAPASFMQQLEKEGLETHLTRALWQDGTRIRYLSDKNRAHNVPLVCAAIKADPTAYRFIRMREGRKRKRESDVPGFIKNNPKVIGAMVSHGTRGIEELLDGLRGDKRVNSLSVAEVLSDLLALA
jgi:hypothetical protein